MNAQLRPAQVPAPVIRHLGLVDYQATWERMQRFTQERTGETPDEL